MRRKWTVPTIIAAGLVIVIASSMLMTGLTAKGEGLDIQTYHVNSSLFHAPDSQPQVNQSGKDITRESGKLAQQTAQNSAEDRNVEEQSKVSDKTAKEIQDFLNVSGILGNFDRDRASDMDVFLYGIPFLEEYNGGSGYGVSIDKAVEFAKEYFGKELAREDLAGPNVQSMGEEYFEFVPQCYDAYDWKVDKVTDIGDGMFKAESTVTKFVMDGEIVLKGIAVVKQDENSSYGFTLVFSNLDENA